MIPLQFENRAKRENFSPDDDEWDLHLVFKLEKDVIDNHLREKAIENWHRFKNTDAALEQMNELNSNIASRYASLEINLPQRYDEATHGTLKPVAPTKGKIRTMTTLLVLSMIAESTVMVMQQVLTRDFNPFIFVIAFMLAVGGWLQGYGVANLLVKSWKERTGRPVSDDHPLLQWGAVAVGTLLILLIAWLRGSTAFDPVRMFLVFSITLLFGEAVSLFEALREKYKEMRTTFLDEMLQAQEWCATILHQQHLADNGYLETYKAAVKLVERSGAQISVSDKPDAATPTTEALPHNA